MSKLLEFFLGSILVASFTIAFLFFSVLQYILKVSSIADCTWQGSAKTWIDSNGDGQVSANEQPLEGVEIYVEQARSPLVDIRLPVITDHNGDVEFNVSIPRCSDTPFEIYVHIPHGYHITTRPRLEVTPYLWESSRPQRVYYFGFTPDR
jgi:hypothetical protein